MERIFDEQGGVDERLRESWRQIDQGIKAGNRDLAWEGNAGLAEYEQKVFLQEIVFSPHQDLWHKMD